MRGRVRRVRAPDVAAASETRAARAERVRPRRNIGGARSSRRAAADCPKKGSIRRDLATRAPLRALVPGNASLHRRAEEASVRERARRGLSFDTRGDGGGTATPATPSVACASEPNAFVNRRREANAAEAPKPSPPRTPASHGNRATASENKCSSKDSNKCDSLFVSCSPASSDASARPSFWSAEKKQKQVLGVSSRAREDANARNLEDRDEQDPIALRARVLRASSPPQASRGDCRRAVALVRARDALESLPARMHAAWRRKRNALREWRRVAGEEASFAALRAVAAESRERRLAKTLSAFTHRQAAGREVSRDVSRDVTVRYSTRSDGNDAMDVFGGARDQLLRVFSVC